ncbi:MAG: TetR family transcriptional regulator [Actinomycetota bacterium]
MSPEVLARRAERRERFLDVADAAIARDGPDVSINQIAAEAGVAKPILYRHFGDKGGLYQALAERYVRGLMEELRAALRKTDDPRTRLATTIDAYLGFVERHPEQYGFLMHRAVGERAAEAQETVADFIRQVAVEIAIELGEEMRRNGLDSGGAEVLAHGLVGMVQLAGDWWLRNRTMPRARVVEYLTSVLWDGFGGMAAAVARDESA